MSQISLEQYAASCDYPGVCNEAMVEDHLRAYMQALGVSRNIVRLTAGWRVEDHPSLKRSVDSILDDWVKRNPSVRVAALDTRAARDALDARAALDALSPGVHRFAAWCVQANGWWWWRWDLAWIVTTAFGARQLKNPDVSAWSEPLLEAFVAGAWLLYWTDDTLYWSAKPIVHKDVGIRRLHNDHGPALESDVENLYLIHGVMVPAFVVVRPDWITIKHIESEENAEVRRIMLDRYGWARYLTDSGAEMVASDDVGELYRKKPIPGDEDLVMVRVMNSTPEPDGSIKPYTLRVPPDMTTARAAVAWTFGMKPKEYQPAIET